MKEEEEELEEEQQQKQQEVVMMESQFSLFTRSTLMLLLLLPLPTGSPSSPPPAPSTLRPTGPPFRGKCLAPPPYHCAARSLLLLPAGDTQLEQKRDAAGGGVKEECRSTGSRRGATNRTERSSRMSAHHLL